MRWTAAAAVSGVFFLLLGVAVTEARPPDRPDYLAAAEIHRRPVEDPATLFVPTPGPTLAPQPSCIVAPPPPPAARTAMEPSQPTPIQPPSPPSCRITALGDSVLLGAVAELEQVLGTFDIDAAIGFQAGNAIDVLRARRDAGQLGDIVLVHIGNNGIVTPEQFDEIMSLVVNVPKVVVVNVKVPRPWEAPNNSVLNAGVPRFPNATLVDWYGASVAHPEVFWDDGIHPRPNGARLYTDLIVAKMKGK
jgi:hypothetical protein